MKRPHGDGGLAEMLWEQKAARGSKGSFLPPLGEEKSSTPKHSYWNGAVKMGAFTRGHRYIRTKRTAADHAATRELLRGMPRGRELGDCFICLRSTTDQVGMQILQPCREVAGMRPKTYVSICF